MRPQRCDTGQMDTDWLGTRRDVVVVEGPDAATYLHSQASQDLSGIEVGESRWTFLLQPTGRVEVLARVTRQADERFQLDTDPGFGGLLAARLNRFKIRVKSDVTEVPAPDGPDDFDDDARIAAGWPRMGVEIIPGETIPAETGLSDVAVSFTKGCYPGQELVERMDSRGAAAPRRLVVLPRRDGDRPGTAIVHDAAEVGTITSVGTSQVLAFVKRGHDGTARDE
jgi:tRNA-modifying protein YgfZ